MATYIKLLFNDNVSISLNSSSFLIKKSHLFDGFDDFTEKIPILCPSNYILDENNKCLFDNETNLYFMPTLLPNKFIEICKFLDIICYENDDTFFSVKFINYVMTNLREEINIIKYFMQPEIKSIMNYLNKEDINIQIRICTLEFYLLYLSEYKEEVIKYNRFDIFKFLLLIKPDKTEYYRYIHKYDNQLTYYIIQTKEYNNYVTSISNKLMQLCFEKNTLNQIKELVEQGANINLHNEYGCNALHIASKTYNNIEVIQYLFENGADINFQCLRALSYINAGCTALHFAACIKNNFEVIKYLVEHGADVNIQNIYGSTALHYVVDRNNDTNIMQYLIKNGANVNIQNVNGDTALHCVVQYNLSTLQYNFPLLNIVQYLLEESHNSAEYINIQNIHGYTALHYVVQYKNELNNIQYFVEHGANIYMRTNNGETVLELALRTNNTIEVINYLQDVVRLQQIT